MSKLSKFFYRVLKALAVLLRSPERGDAAKRSRRAMPVCGTHPRRDWKPWELPTRA